MYIYISRRASLFFVETEIKEGGKKVKIPRESRKTRISKYRSIPSSGAPRRPPSDKLITAFSLSAKEKRFPTRSYFTGMLDTRLANWLN